MARLAKFLIPATALPAKFIRVLLVNKLAARRDAPFTLCETRRLAAARVLVDEYERVQPDEGPPIASDSAPYGTMSPVLNLGS